MQGHTRTLTKYVYYYVIGKYNRNLKVKHWTIEVFIIEPTSICDAYQYTALGKLINMKR